MDLMTIYQPHAIGPQIPYLLKKIKEINFRQFLCPCTAMFKAEPSFRAHLMSGPHQNIQEKLSTFSEIYTRLPELDLELLGDVSKR